MSELFQHKLTQEVFKKLQLPHDLLQELFAPQEIPMKDAAIAKVATFLQSAQKLMICGDFDADGVTSTSIAALIAECLGIEYGFYIPDRIKDGYGTSAAIVEAAHHKGYTHLLMVDNGVKAFEAITKCHELGLKIAIVDHHNCGDSFEVDAFLHPDCIDGYGASMSAAGLMYLVAEYLGLATPKLTALAAIGTIADVMPLWHKNREIVIKGLKVLNEGKILQVDAIAQRTRFTTYTATSLAFQVIPKINSVGRLSDQANMNTMVHFFTQDDPEMIRSYAQQMSKINDLRKTMSADMGRLAMSLIKPGVSMNVVSHPDFHEGILGIIANQMLQNTGVPSIVLKERDDFYKGSSRSASISLSRVFESLDRDYFLALGGHDFAYGLSVHQDQFKSFKKQVESFDVSQYPMNEETPLEIDIHDITKEALLELNQFEPFGEGFKMPMMKIPLPQHYVITPIKDIGYKLSFEGLPVDEAVVFGKNITHDDLQNASFIIGVPSYNSFRKVSIMIDALESDELVILD